MKTLWFKQIYVDPILRGDKTDTIRRATCKVDAGEVLAFTVGPRFPFATVKIIDRENIDASRLPPGRKQIIKQLYGNDPVCRLSFRLL